MKNKKICVTALLKDPRLVSGMRCVCIPFRPSLSLFLQYETTWSIAELTCLIFPYCCNFRTTPKWRLYMLTTPAMMQTAACQSTVMVPREYWVESTTWYPWQWRPCSHLQAHNPQQQWCLPQPLRRMQQVELSHMLYLILLWPAFVCFLSKANDTRFNICWATNFATALNSISCDVECWNMPFNMLKAVERCWTKIELARLYSVQQVPACCHLLNDVNQPFFKFRVAYWLDGKIQHGGLKIRQCSKA